MNLNFKYNKIFVKRGTNNANSMETLEVIQEISRGIYEFKNGQLIDSVRTIDDKNRDLCKRMESHVNLIGIWDITEAFELRDQMNVLGISGVFCTQQASITINKLATNQCNLDYFGVTLVNDRDIFMFETPQTIPLTIMKIGPKYAEQTLLKNRGFYLEKHDLPHFHSPINIHSGGVYILAKQVKENHYIVNAFDIPLGKSIYTPAGIIHCDAFLTGFFNVAYGVTSNYSTKNLHMDVIFE
jgi:hypothetical protein